MRRTAIYGITFVVWTVLSISGALRPLDTLASAFSTPSPVWRIITYFGSYEFLASLALLASIFLKERERIKISIGTVGTGLLVKVLKEVFRIPRPSSLVSGFSYPSGHSAVGFFLYINLYRSCRGRKISYFFLLLAILVPLSRLFLGVHWLSDVIGGILLALFLDSLISESLKKVRLGKWGDENTGTEQ